jgi:hypothetical protein
MGAVDEKEGGQAIIIDFMTPFFNRKRASSQFRNNIVGRDALSSRTCMEWK